MNDRSGVVCQDCKHQIDWHGRHGCYAISAAGACACKKSKPVADLMHALRVGLRATCPVCGGAGFIAHKQFIDDGYGEVDSCPACEVRHEPAD